MPRGQLSEVVRNLRAVVSGHDADSVTDGELLELFVRHKDESAFDALVRRHGPMVLGVCRRVLGDAHDAEDAFQAAFLVLVRKAASIRPCSQVGNWLHGVAHRTALEAKRLAAKRRAKEAKAVPRTETPADLWTDLRPLLDQEIANLPKKYRAVLVLCDLEGKGRKEAAEQLRLPEGTVASRLARARARLAKRLARQGLAVSGGALAVLLLQKGALAAVPAALLGSTTKAAVALAAGRVATAGVISAQVGALMEGVMKVMLLSKIKMAALALVVSVGFLLGVGAWANWPPAPTERVTPGQGSHSFAPVGKNWIVHTTWLQPDPPDSYLVVEDKDRDPDYKDYQREDRYFAQTGDKQPCKILRYFPSGVVAAEIDNLNDGPRLREQFSRSYYPDGSPRGFTHWKDGKWLDGGSVSPDGRVIQRLKDGAGELVAYGAKEGNHVHSWYSGGDEYLEKRSRDGACVQIRLNDGSDWFIAHPGEEELLQTGRGEAWMRRSGQEVRYQRTDRLPIFDHGEQALEAVKMRVQYPQRRADFMKGYGQRLEKAGKTWVELKIEFLPVEGAWPD